MASLEIHYGLYRIVFRYAGQKFCRSLKTDKERTANAALARVLPQLADDVERGVIATFDGSRLRRRFLPIS
jgi:ribosomal protein S20